MYSYRHHRWALSEILDRADKIPQDVQKYWKRRRNLFSKYNEGIKLTRELWFSVTAEAVANYLAKFIQHCYPETRTVVDLFCGGGGNSIQMIRLFDRCICVDYNETNLACTKNNVYVYFSPEQLQHAGKTIEFVHCDWKYALPTTSPTDQAAYNKTQQFIQNIKSDIVFASPPWGGPEYLNQEKFNLRNIEPLPLEDLLRSCLQISPVIVLFLPRNSDLDQLMEISRQVFGPGVKVRVTKAVMRNRVKGLLCFWGDKFYDYQRK
ncbi:hypothetical protein OGAPHI_001931 [Ogataea philodendri]|uniref:Trimethylguanosine synthase n=1 Tax=Ogataea philodendri TaxID=1378263 RepID=A0A9P8PA15_9ASCO|nr:uncharacterized protein OGAPHI_001931 [Ogataea philodendri]KAH3668177.1 hypothetical protein OGAPHI_001931 [Ogataea philodendri]